MILTAAGLLWIFVGGMLVWINCRDFCFSSWATHTIAWITYLTGFVCICLSVSLQY